MAMRNFKVAGSDSGFAGGVFHGKSPSTVAKKAANSIFSKHPSKTTVEFFLKETTNDSLKKEFAYKATKKVLSPPKIVKIAGKDVEIKKEIKVKALKMHK